VLGTILYGYITYMLGQRTGVPLAIMQWTRSCDEQVGVLIMWSLIRRLCWE
jgi:hypothetical protein